MIHDTVFIYLTGNQCCTCIYCKIDENMFWLYFLLSLCVLLLISNGKTMSLILPLRVAVFRSTSCISQHIQMINIASTNFIIHTNSNISIRKCTDTKKLSSIHVVSKDNCIAYYVKVHHSYKKGKGCC